MLGKMIGGILLISGTAIGVGMLAVPTVTAAGGFFNASATLFLCWIFMTISAFLILEVNLSLIAKGDYKRPINLITMADATLGSIGKITAWLIYILLLYSLVSVYIRASSAWLSQLSAISMHYSAIIVSGIFAIIISTGTAGVDKLNRIFSIGLLIAYIILVITILPHVDSAALCYSGNISTIPKTMPLLLTAFGSAIVVPSLTSYLEYNKKALRITLLIGCLLPLCTYIIWELVTLGTLPLDGEFGLNTLARQNDDGTGLAIALENVTKSWWVTESAMAFAIFAVLTSFIGVSLSLMHFLSDGLKTDNKILLPLLIYVPATIMAMLFPGGFAAILSVSGVFVAIFLGLLPIAMAWKIRGKCSALMILAIVFFLYVIFQQLCS